MVHTEHPTTHHLSPAQTARRILRATGALMLVQVILRCFGLVEKMIMSQYFGTGDEANAYSAAKRIAEPIRLFGEQVIMHSFLPAFVLRMRERGDKDAWRMASTIINLMALLTALVAIVSVFYTHQVLMIFAPDLATRHPELVPLTMKIARVMLVAMIFLAVSSVTYCLLNSYKQFALPASSDLALKATVLVFAILFARSWGAYALAVGFVFGALLKVGVQVIGMRRQVLEYRPVADLKHPGVKHFILLALPLIIGWAFSTLRSVMDTRFLSGLPHAAGFSALDYAKTPCDIPVTFFPYVFGIALFPFLADIAAAGDKERLRGMLMTATRMMVLIFVPLSIAFILLRFPIILGLYGSKKFGMESAILTAGPMQFYALGMLVGALEIIVLQFFFAMSDTLRPTIIGMIMVPLHIGVAYFGIHYWGLGAMAIALALFVSKSSKIVVLYVTMRQKLQSLEGQRMLLLLGKVVIALLPFILLLLVGAHYLPWPAAGHDVGKMKKLLMLFPFVVLGGAAMLVYLTLLHFLRVDEVNMLVERVRGKLGKKVAVPEQAGVE